ncbi:virulence factor SrfB [Pelagicoccus sp. NFK12]|uniref:Virulence factor SrfB n=1 Tax=Pelagicoccus enzymogenes TaxID=2773457 RepID=A0A927IH36_9BACT|nr:virulence factor SrfB [Pelagicoccus enzymogenes]MBD5779791.1 virulence factor SrfB [Pelagicoccus enzymogenes]
MADKAPTRIEIFPNTGPQTCVLPLKELLPERPDDFLTRLVEKNRAGWQPWAEITPWIRYRFDFENDTPVLFVAVETNLGEPYRGLLVDVEDRLYESAPDEEEFIPFYAAYDEFSIEEEYGNRREIPLLSLPNQQGLDLPINLVVQWERSHGRLPIDVDLIVDLGNSRTVGLLLETPDPGLEMPFERRVRPLRFTPRGMPYEYQIDNQGGLLDDPYAIINSWMILHETLFQDLEPEPPFAKIQPEDQSKKTSVYWAPANRNGKKGYVKKVYIPHGFAELSPAIIGGARHSDGAEQILARANLDRMAKFFLSSPKRYAWDSVPLSERGGTVWMQIPNGYGAEDGYNSFQELNGLIRCFMHPEGSQFDWNVETPPDEERFRGVPLLGTAPTYPRRDAICWFALSVIEAAYRQINAPGYIHTSQREPRPRRLRKVRVSYPAGWTDEERSRYLEQWQRALNLFSLIRFENLDPIAERTGEKGGDRPILADPPLDEAVCSQLPIIYSDISSLGNSCSDWLHLYGNGRVVTVMNVDIGGGTTDMAINRYRAENHPAGIGQQQKFELIPDLRFRHGSRIAGDMLVKTIIEELVVPAWLRNSSSQAFEKITDAEQLIRYLFQTPTDANLMGVDAKAMSKLVRFLRLCLIPLANALLGRLSEAKETDGWGPLIVEDIIEPRFVEDFNKLVDRLVKVKSVNGRLWRGPAFPVEGARLTIDRDALVRCIDRTFSGLLDTLSDLAGRHRCDLVIVSGKPSELPRIRELMLRKFPLLPQRIIHVKSFPAGHWYPFKRLGSDRITDAKTCTVVGAALFQDICNGNLNTFTIRPADRSELSRRFCWGFARRNMLPRDFFNSNNLLFRPSELPRPQSGQDRVEFEKSFADFPLNIRIGRQIETMRDLQPDPVYEVSLDPSRYPGAQPYTADVTLRWVSERGKGEYIELVKVSPSTRFPEIDPAAVRFLLNTLLEESFWLDDPSLEIASV